MSGPASYPSGEIRPRPPKRNWLFIVVPLAVCGAFGAFVLLVIGAVFVLGRNSAFAPPVPRRPAESLAEKRQANDEAFGKAGAGMRSFENDIDAEDVHALSALLERIPSVRTPEQVEVCFDIERMYQEVGSATSNQKLFRTPGTFRGFRQGFTERVASKPLLNCVSSEIRRVKFLDGRDEAIVFSQHRTAEGLGTKMRWWVARSRGKWKIYDFEELDLGLRASATAAALMDVADNQGLSTRQSEAIDAVTTATELLVQGKYDEAEQRVRATLDVPLSKPLAAWRLSQLATVETSRARWADVVDLVDRAAGIYPDMPVLLMLRVQALNGLGRFEEAAVGAGKYIAELGGDDYGSFLLGTALAGLSKKDEAVDAFREGLSLYANSVDNLVGLAGVLPADAMGEIADRFAKFERPMIWFPQVAGELVDKENAAALAAVVARHREIVPRDPHNDYYQGQLHWIRQEYDQSAEAFRQALPRMPKDKQVGCQRALRNSLASAGKFLEAYQAMPDADDTLLSVCNPLVRKGDADGLDRLTELHAQRRPDDPWLPYFRGEAQVLRGEYEQAAATFRPMLGRQLPDGMRNSYRDEYVAAQMNAGHPLEAYGALTDAAFAFEKVADALVDRWDGADTLEELIAAHSERLPDDPWLGYYRGRLLIMRSRYREAAELLAPLFDKTRDERLKAELAEACRAALLYDGRPQEAYSVSLDRETSFERTAAYLVQKLDVKQIAALIATRQAEQADDPWLPYYQAQLAALNFDYRAVAVLLTPVVASAADGEPRDRMVNLLLHALYEMGDTGSACQAVRPGEAFDFLAERLADDHEVEGLEELLTAYEGHAPDDPRLPYFRGRLAQLRGRADEAAAVLTAWFKAVNRDEDELHSYLQAMAAVRHPLEAYHAAPDALLALGPLARELAWRGEADLLEELLDAHAKEHADDPWFGYWRGRALLLRGKEDEALAAYASALRSANGDELELLSLTWEEYAILGKPLEGYRTTADAVQAFEHFGESLLDNRDFGRLRQLVVLHESKHPDDPLLAWLKAELLIADGKYTEAMDLLEPRLADEDSLGRYEAAHGRAVVKAGRVLDVYRVAPDKQVAFARLASTLYDASDATGLAALIDAHRESHPHDPWLKFYAAQQLRLTRKYDEAELAFAAALAESPPDFLRSRVTAARIASRFDAGKSSSAYEEIEPRLATLNALVDLCRSNRDGAQLEQLIVARRERYPLDARLKEWELETASWKSDDESLLRFLDEAGQAVPQSARWKLPGLRARALVRLKRFGEARAVLDSNRAIRPAPQYYAMVEAAAGNVAAATTALSNCLRWGIGVQQLYRGPELGRILRGDAFATFRERHPEAPPGDATGVAGDRETRAVSR